MAPSPGSAGLPILAALADGLVVALVAFACAIAETGGIRATIGGVFVSVTSPTRPLLFAAVIAALRHVKYRRPGLHERAARAVGWGLPLAAKNAEMARGAGRDGSSIAKPEIALVAGLMIVLTLVLTYPQIRQLYGVTDLGDPLFSIWRLSWIAHQLPRDPLHLFDANIFYPERVTLAYNESVLLPALAGVPLIWLGLSAVVVHSLLLMTTFVLAGVCMYLFVRATTGQSTAAVVAAVAFAFYPFRLGHYCHFEQIFTFWMPLVLWGLHRTLTRGRIADGLLTGAAVAGQYLSGMYMAAFLLAYLVPVWALLALGTRSLRSSIKPLLAGGALAVILVAPVAIPYFQARQVVGERLPEAVEFYSARPADYLAEGAGRLVYKKPFGREPHVGERELFPGLLVVVLAAIGLWPPLSVARVAYAAGLLFAFDASLGMHGHVFPFLYWHFLPFRAFRVPARFSMLVGLSLVMLGAQGVSRLMSRIRVPAWRWAVAGLLATGFAVEAWSNRTLQQVSPQPPAVYGWFRDLPTGVIADLPAPTDLLRLFEPDARYMYFSTFHWHPLLNGYTGAFPQSYLAFRRAMEKFPDDASMALLRKQGADYVVLHEGFYGRERYREVVDALARRADVREVSRASDNGYQASIFALVK